MDVICTCSIRHHIDATFGLTHISRVPCMPCSGCDIHTPYVLCVTVMCVLMGCTGTVFWLQTALHRPPGCKWPSRPWMNDNASQLAEPYDTFVCDSAVPGQATEAGGLGLENSCCPLHTGFSFFPSADSGHPSLWTEMKSATIAMSPFMALCPDANFTVRDNREVGSLLQLCPYLLPSPPPPS